MTLKGMSNGEYFIFRHELRLGLGFGLRGSEPESEGLILKGDGGSDGKYSCAL